MEEATKLTANPSVRCQQITAAQTVSLRHSVLWPDAPISHVILPEDAQGWHYGAFIVNDSSSDDHPIAVISLFVESCPQTDSEGDADAGKAIRFRKFACDPAYQGRGIGTSLLQHVLSVARAEFGGTLLWCDAREATKGWYQRRGLLPFGTTFWKGPVEYIRMKIDL
ncbi:acyl-CoA N-acyltransferase [Roridomyces roridus]|uniref:Acyl-CoA N-acyltransferase n=1 Tax=Roridomyces roridus TaxID=1738132 RepID=A0AAD7CC68_9AGAR|nr:acyl-CoA N-acyltransferase [Roridomyces roridus]